MVRKANSYSYLDELDSSWWAYLAGIIDGEGTICIAHKNRKKHKESRYHQPYLSITQADVPYIEWLYGVLGELGNIHIRFKGQHRIQCSWNIYSGKAVAVLERVLPYLRIKKLQAEGAIELQKHIDSNKMRPLAKEDLEYRDWVKQRISDLNQRKLEPNYVEALH